jgi:hypothetical protein
MSKLAASLAVLAVTAGLALAGGGIALADDDHNNDPNYGSCSQPHSVNVANCATVLQLGHLGTLGPIF